jgi:hypothetical protein
MRYFISILFFIVSISFLSCAYTHSKCALLKVKHCVPISFSQKSIQKSSVELCFSNAIAITQTKDNNGQASIFIPHATIDTFIDNSKQDDYEVTIAAIESPVKGVEITIVYNPSELSFRYDVVPEILSGSKLIFAFFDKKMCSRLKDYNNPIILYAETKLVNELSKIKFFYV